MRRTTLAIVLLSVSLVASSLWWLYGVIDSGITASYLRENLDRHHLALGQALAVAPVAARVSATREEVLQAARAASADDQGFVKEGFVWVGELGYRFDESGRLVELRTNWSPS
jgi:hypothetical protein